MCETTWSLYEGRRTGPRGLMCVYMRGEGLVKQLLHCKTGCYQGCDVCV